MAFANRRADHNKATDNDASQKRRPLAKWLNRKRRSEDADLPTIDATAGLNRVLRASATTIEGAAELNRAAVRSALSSIEAALYVIDQVREIMEQAYEVALSAREAEDAGGRALLAESYDELRMSINLVIADCDEQAGQLVGKQRSAIDVQLGGSAKYSVSPICLDISDKGLDLSPPRHAFSNFDEIDQVVSELDAAVRRADRAAAGYCRDAQYLIARLAADAAR